MVHINHKIGNFFFHSCLSCHHGMMRSAIWEYLRGTFAFPQHCPPASLSTLTVLCTSLLLHSFALSAFIVWNKLGLFSHHCRRYQKRKPTMSGIMKALLLVAVLVCVSRAQRKFLFSLFFKWQHFILTCLSFSSGWQERSLTNKPCSLLSSLQSLHQKNVFAEGPGGWRAWRLK